ARPRLRPPPLHTEPLSSVIDRTSVSVLRLHHTRLAKGSSSVFDDGGQDSWDFLESRSLRACSNSVLEGACPGRGSVDSLTHVDSGGRPCSFSCFFALSLTGTTGPQRFA